MSNGMMESLSSSPPSPPVGYASPTAASTASTDDAQTAATGGLLASPDVPYEFPASPSTASFDESSSVDVASSSSVQHDDDDDYEENENEEEEGRLRGMSLDSALAPSSSSLAFSASPSSNNNPLPPRHYHHKRQPTGCHETEIISPNNDSSDSRDRPNDRVKQNVVQTPPVMQLSQQFPQKQLSTPTNENSNGIQPRQQQVETSTTSAAATTTQMTAQEQPIVAVTAMASSATTTTTAAGRRSITLRLLEEVTPSTSSSQGRLSSNQQHPSSSAISPPPTYSTAATTTTKISSFRAIQRLRSLSAGSGRFFAGYTSATTAAATPDSTDDNTIHQRAGSDSEIHPLKDTSRQQHGETSVVVNTNSNISSCNLDNGEEEGGEKLIEHGIITISWYDGTTSTEMVEHVHNCVMRKIQQQQQPQQGGTMKLVDVRLLDEIVTPNSHGEVVLCPFLPDGSAFVLKFKIIIELPPSISTATTAIPPTVTKSSQYIDPSIYLLRAPESPSRECQYYNQFADQTLPDGTIIPAAPLLPSNNRRNSNDIPTFQQQQHIEMQRMLSAVATLLLQQQQQQRQNLSTTGSRDLNNTNMNGMMSQQLPPLPDVDDDEKKDDDVVGGESGGAGETATTSTDRMIEEQLRHLNELFLRRNNSSFLDSSAAASATANAAVNDDKNSNNRTAPDEAKLVNAYRRAEKKQVIFVISNYLVLFLSLIALSAEIQSRLPQWMAWVQENYDSVQNCATDQAALIECLSNGDFSGLVASALLWATQSASAKRIFLFGFKTPKKLWTVVYEALVSAACWGMSYLFIRRGLNPNTRQNFIQLYWKDAAYGSLAGFNAAFMKAILKNLVPEEVALEALEGRQLRIVDWFHSLMANE